MESLSSSYMAHGGNTRTHPQPRSPGRAGPVPRQPATGNRTVLNLLGLPEHTHFMGRSVLNAYPGSGRAFIAIYQKLGYLTSDRLVVLSPGRQIED